MTCTEIGTGCLTDLVDEAERLQREFRLTRVRWARKIGRPYSCDIEAPEPGVIDDGEPEEG